MDHARALRSIRALLAFFIAALALSGLTAIPLRAELALAERILAHASWAPDALLSWLRLVAVALETSLQGYPFLAYGTDWLAFAHIVIALAFLGPLLNPARNRWVIEWGLAACVLVIPTALIFGALRGIPLWWRLVDCSFGVFGLIPLWWARRLVLRMGPIAREGVA
jgi:hypothetical protein